MPNSRHGEVGGVVHYLLMSFVKPLGLGRVLVNDTFIRTGPDSYRGMDLCYVSYSRIPKHIKLPNAPIPAPPELVVEILSPSNRPGEMLQKVDEYHAVGVDVVAVVDPELEIVSVYRKDELPQRFHNGDIFEIPDVLPGFSCPLKSLFV